MLAVDLTSGHSSYLLHKDSEGHCTLPGVILGPPSGSTFSLETDSCVSESFTGTDLVQYSGCGYPDIGTVDQKPWRGNCAATGLLLGGTQAGTEGDEVQGTFCDTIKSAAIEIAIHSLNAPATVCANFIADSDNDSSGQVSDPDSVSLWLDGPATKSQYSNGRLGGGFNSILDTPGDNQADGIGISNVQVAGNIALGTNSNATLIAAHGQTTAPPLTLFESSGADLVQIAGANLPQWIVASDSTAGLAALSCSANVFATAVCSQVKTAPMCIVGCTGVSGNDGGFAVAVSSGATTITVQLAGKYTAAPICTVSAGPPAGSISPYAYVSGVSFQPWGTTVTFKTSVSVTSLYGSCHGPTG